MRNMLLLGGGVDCYTCLASYLQYSFREQHMQLVNFPGQAAKKIKI